nr:hypothetical protein [Tanacetum cinerariifolium]
MEAQEPTKNIKILLRVTVSVEDDVSDLVKHVIDVVLTFCSKTQLSRPGQLAPTHHQHHHTPVNPQQQSVSLQPFISSPVTQQSQAKFPQLDYGLSIPIFQQGDDLSEYINKAMTFIFVVASRNKGIATTSRGNYAARQPRVVKCYNFQGERLMARQSYPIISKAPVAQQTIPHNLAFQTKDLDVYDSDCDDLSLAKAVLMENLSSYDLDVLSEVPYSDSSQNDMINQDVQE